MTPRFHITPTARKQLIEAVRDTKRKWGLAQSKRYNEAFLAGLNKLAKNHKSIGTGHRAAMTRGTDFQLHLIEHRYVVFLPHDNYNIIIAGIFHERMDIPARVQELALLTRDEIDAIAEQIDRG
jgi:toxin ParE1/3/4